MEKERIRYFNEMLARLEELVYHEIGLTCVKKVDLVGIDLLQKEKIVGRTVEEVIDQCIEKMKAIGIVKDIQYSIHGYGILLKLEVKGCIHIPKEEKLRKDGLTPYMCPIANMIGDRIIEILNYETTYMANMEIDEAKEECIVKYALFETVDKIGQVSDWTKI